MLKCKVRATSAHSRATSTGHTTNSCIGEIIKIGPNCKHGTKSWLFIIVYVALVILSASWACVWRGFHYRILLHHTRPSVSFLFLCFLVRHMAIFKLSSPRAGVLDDPFCRDPDALSEQQAKVMLHKVSPRHPRLIKPSVALLRHNWAWKQKISELCMRVTKYGFPYLTKTTVYPNPPSACISDLSKVGLHVQPKSRGMNAISQIL